MNHPLLSKGKENLVYWAIAVVYALVVAAGSGGLWWVLTVTVVSYVARVGFPEMVKMFILTKETDAVSRFSTDKESKKLVLTLAVTAALFTMAVPLNSALAACLGNLVAYYGFKRNAGAST